MKQLIKDTSGAPTRYATCEWFYHAPLKQEDMSVSAAVLPPTSQIPGLSDLAEPHNESFNQSRKKWIKDTDSDYVKLAKQGGRPELLKQVESTKKSSSVYNALPEWYTHVSENSPAEYKEPPLRNIPDYMVHEELNTSQHEQKYEGKRGPFDFDQKSVWQRDSEGVIKENQEDKKQVKLPDIKTRFKGESRTLLGKVPPTIKAKGAKLGKKCFFPPMPVSQNKETVNISKLMSNGYGNDWFQQHGDLEDKLPHKPKLI
ncbi:uncharacterized protein C7orf57 homolog [Xenopus tropicalis]|uniref:LOC100170423 protein n=1 Tax=Xenopus tropicalis TaxID=8364 RepID=B2RYZ7_XENTR|nr:uncharacterized protein C7orf57 homolog [Xenopus tropicalis]AAI66964.1 LOC100170423 protein [Xenopus tropicalis]|eukprot:NP_001123673.1 uncharacterized protein C7orf57 homolog [Xenopus tropicalis]